MKVIQEGYLHRTMSLESVNSQGELMQPTNWFQGHAYIATWLSPFIAISVFLLRGGLRKDTKEIDWTMAGLFFVLVTSLAVLFTPIFDAKARDAAFMLLFFALGALVVGRKRT